MASRLMMEAFQRGRERSAEVDRGTAISGGLRFSSQKAADSKIENVARLPTVLSNDNLQDPYGAFYYLEGYSDPTGPDLPLP
jgi:hypothetical protein